MLRQLSLTPISSVMGAPSGSAAAAGAAPPGGGQTVRADDSLRTALSLLLQTRGPAITVIGNGGSLVGQLTFEDIRRAVLASRTGAAS